LTGAICLISGLRRPAQHGVVRVGRAALGRCCRQESEIGPSGTASQP
jgi:hypothetical protein